MEEHDSCKNPTRLTGVHAGSALLSPPYSPFRQRLQLLSLDELDEDEYSGSSSQPETALESPETLEGIEWRDGVGELERMNLHLDGDVNQVGEEDWDEPLFLNNSSPSNIDDSEGLDLTLFESSPFVDESSLSFSGSPSSPSIRSSSLPELEDLPEDRTSNALLNPSDFDVFNNGWDAVVSDSTQNASPSKQHIGEEGLEFDPDFSFRDAHRNPSPVSPSRRNVINLPGADDYIVEDDEPGHNLPPRPSSPVNLPDAASCNAFSSSPWYRTFDVPVETFQSPLNLPLLLSPPSVAYQSLLFAPPGPEYIPLPESPANERHLLGLPHSDADADGDDGITDVPLHLLEETRLRVLQHESLLAEQQARMKEALLTDYIKQLNELQPPREYVASPFDSMEILDGKGISMIPAQRAGPGPATLQFLNARRKDVQHMISLRAIERRKRKRAKERSRELEALLQLKSAQLRADALRSRSRSRLISHTHSRAGSDDDEAVVLTASGADLRQAHVHDLVMTGPGNQNELGAGKGRQEEISQLVAKMIFRRRDSPRPLTGKVLLPSRPYRRSRLSLGEEDIENGTLEDAN